ncbi:Cell division trigger factor [Lachnospiraceae bacterium TWA4]|nr:Cell division trigger factor [Lachnospiraceae bacterium TWA4]
MNSIDQLAKQIQLGKYKGLKCPKAVITVYDAEVMATLEMECQSHEEQVEVEREAKKGDAVVIDYVGTVDGVAFEGGTSNQPYPLVLGSNTFIPGFEDQLIGVKKGEEVDVKVTFPTQYHAPNLAGKDANFHVTVHKVCEHRLPDLDDEFAKKYGNVDTLEEYKAVLKARLTSEKEQSAKYSRQQGLLEEVIKNSPFELSEELIDFRINQLIEQYAQRLSMQGLTMEQYYQYTGSTEEKLKKQLFEEAVKQLQNTIVLQAIAEVENLEATEEDFDKQVEEMAKTYSMQKADVLAQINDEIKESILADLRIQKALELIDEYSVEE